MTKLIKFLFWSSIAVTTFGILTTLTVYLYLKPDLPEISLVDQSQLQIPLKIYTSDGVLIGEFGEKKRRPISFDDIPDNLKNAFLAAEDDGFFRHQGISYTGILRSFIRCIGPNGCFGGGGTISMQVVRGYVLTRDQTVIRKLKEILLAYQLESSASKNEIFELYVNSIFLGNRSYGIESAADTYFGKTSQELSLAESALIASLAQLPSRVNPIKAPERTKSRRNWILGRMLKLRYISNEDYVLAIAEPVNISKNIKSYDLDSRHLAELIRQEIINRYGLKAYTEGWEVYSTIDSKLQTKAIASISERLSEYDKRHGWRQKNNYLDIFSIEDLNSLLNLDYSPLTDGLAESFDFTSDVDTLIERVRDAFDSNTFIHSHKRGIVIDVNEDNFIYLSEDLKVLSIDWDEELYKWARRYISINSRGAIPQNFYDLIKPGDFIYLKSINDAIILDQIPLAEAALISIDPKTGSISSYVGGSSFNDGLFDRVRLSFPQTGSSFKPFVYAAAFANNYNPSSLINDAPIIFNDENLESFWRPENYTGKFYGPTRLREGLVQSLNIVSIKLLRELGISKANNYISKFGFERNRLPNDLSLALGSGNFSPAEVARSYGVLANDGYLVDLYYVSKILDRNGNDIFTHKDITEEQEIDVSSNMTAFPWLNTLELEAKKPYSLLNNVPNKNRIIDERVTHIVKDILKEHTRRGSTGRKTGILKRSDIAGKTGTTNDAKSTWFSGFHEDLVTTVWVGTDDFTSLGDNEYGSSIALPIWVDYMSLALDSLPESKITIPSGISYVKVNKSTGEIANPSDKNTYFELFLNENIPN
jgi:penicillin-binding protein 1A